MGWLDDTEEEPTADYSTPDFSYDDSSSVPLTLGDSLISGFGESPASSYSAGQSSQARDPSLDAMGILKDALAANSRQIDGITAHRDKLRDERNSLSQTTTNDWSGVGSAILTGLAGLAVGGSPGEAATAGGRSGVSYYNNLDADEKRKQLNLDNDIKFDDSMIGKLTDYGSRYTDQQATFTHADALQASSQAAADARQTQAQGATAALANAEGRIPGTDAFKAVEQAKIDFANARPRGTGLDEMADPQIVRANAAFLGLDPEKPITNRAYREALASKGLVQAGDRTENAQSRFEANQTTAAGKTAAPGFFDNYKDPSSGVVKPLNAKQIDTVGNIGTGLDTILRNSDALISDLKTNRFSYDDALRKQQQELYNMMPAIRALDKQGVRFNQFIKDIDIKQIGDDADLTDRFMGWFTGQDPAAAMQRFASEITKQAAATAVQNNAVLNPEKVKAFSPGSYNLLNKYGAFNFNKSAAPASGGPSKQDILDRISALEAKRNQ